jgi:hypothetical protein
MSDKSIEFLESVQSKFEAIGIKIGYFSPTQTGLKKSIFDAHEKLCEFFKTVQIHDFMAQGKGAAAKRLIEVSVISNRDEKKLTVSLYRPDTKQGDPRFWISGIKNYVMPDDLLIFILLNQKLYLVNCCDPNLFKNGDITNYLLQVIKQKMNQPIEVNSKNFSVDKLDLISFPKDLVEWAGHHSGGVKRLFDVSSGRPGKDLLKTNLIIRLENWVSSVVKNEKGIPRILFLVGGPGNGKTEAIENTIKKFDLEFNANGQIVNQLAKDFLPSPGQPVPRVVTFSGCDFSLLDPNFRLDIVQDATATEASQKASASKLLIHEIDELLASESNHYYLCCINRGVLDEALIEAIDEGNSLVSILIEEITKVVSLSSSAPQCWPLINYPNIAVWPMDVESLFIPKENESASVANALIRHAVNSNYWKPMGTCEAGVNCPFCNSQAVLHKAETSDALLKILRWYELHSGKRWSFRDLFSLISYLLSGHRPETKGRKSNPCEWANSLVSLDVSSKTNANPSKQELSAIFYLATSGYQHALFHQWQSGLPTEFKDAIKDLGIDKSTEVGRILLGFQLFMTDKQGAYLPATISSLLSSISEKLDPAMANPETIIEINTRSTIYLAELDARFSKSVQSGFDYVKKLRLLNALEVDLLKRIAKADLALSDSINRRKKPTAANFIQRCLRDFSCRFVRRSICTRFAVITDLNILQAFQEIVEDENGQKLHAVSKQVKDLLNETDGFHVSLTTTFGQPLPPKQRQTTLIVPQRNVRPLPLSNFGRPKSPICYLKIGTGDSAQAIPLTFELFKAINELDRGLSPASLSLNVVALLDATKARLSGPIVRDHDLWEDAKINIGSDGSEISKAFDGFVSLARNN